MLLNIVNITFDHAPLPIRTGREVFDLPELAVRPRIYPH